MSAERRPLQIGAAVIAILMVALILRPAPPAAAEASAVRVILSYVPTMSNWGPIDANGVVQVTFAEGDVRGDFIGLDPLDGANVYEVWLRNSQSGKMFSLARFTPDPDRGASYVDEVLDGAIPEEGWDLVVVTVEPEPDTSPDPDARWSIVGSFPGTEIETQQFPPVLPETGIRPAGHAGQVYAALALGLSVLVTLVLRQRPIRGNDRKEMGDR